MRGTGLTVILALTVGAYAGTPMAAEPAGDEAVPDQVFLPPAGSTQIFRELTAAAPGHELIVADLNLPADAVGEAHYHPWEEYLYVIVGSALLDIAGADERVLRAGQSFVIPPETVHTPRAGPHGVRAIVVRVHKQGDPVTIPAGR